MPNTEYMNRQSLMKELEIQKDKVDRAEKLHNEKESLKKTPIKRKKKFSDNSAVKQKHASRAKLDDNKKAKIQADDTEKHKIRRANLDDKTKAKIQADNTEKHKIRRTNLDDNLSSWPLR